MTAEALSLRSPGEPLAIVPYLLGFQPSDSIMCISDSIMCISDSIMCICVENSRIGLTQRLDLPPAGEGEKVVQAPMPSLMRVHPDQVLLIAYENEPDRSAVTCTRD